MKRPGRGLGTARYADCMGLGRWAGQAGQGWRGYSTYAR